MRPEMLAEINDPPETVYNPPDVFNPSLHPPPGAIDVLKIVEAGVDFRSVLNPDYTSFYKKPTFANPLKVPVGKGVQLDTQAGDTTCDGSVDSWCKRSEESTCLLYGHNDGRNGLKYNSYSGWIVMNIPDLKNGIIMIKNEGWHIENEMWRTKGWTSINNEPRVLGSTRGDFDLTMDHSNTTTFWAERNNNNNNNNTSSSSLGRRKLGGKEEPQPCEDFRFEYAIDGKVTSLSEDDMTERVKKVQRDVTLIVLLNDPDYTGATGGEEREVEVAVRITGCGRKKVFNLNHIYWS
jgi:hypothetical protein